jgi:hypothetical protein
MLNMRPFLPRTIAALGSGSVILALNAAPVSAWWIFNRGTSKADIPAAQYQACATKLDKAGIKGDAAAKACSEVVRPEELGECVEDIMLQKADINPTLKACTQVRRPRELGICVTEIRRQDKTAPLPETLEYCRRSLLPAQYGGCVVGFNRRPLQLATKDGFNTCIDASDRPTDLRPNFIPIDRLPSLTNSLPTPSNSTPSSSSTSPSPSPSPTTTPQLY